MNKARIIVIGDRDFNNYDLLHSSIVEVLFEIDDTNTTEVEFVSGACRGVDILEEQFAYSYGYNIKKFPTNCDELGKRVEYIRNVEMVKYASEVDNGILIAFWDGISKGTKNMIDIANRYGLDVKVVRY